MTPRLVRTGRPAGQASFRRAAIAAVLAAGVMTSGCNAAPAVDATKAPVRVPSATATWSAGPSATASAAPFSGNPFREGDPFISPEGSPAAVEAARTKDPARRAVLDRLAGVPTAAWVLPEHHPTGTVGHHVADLVHQAEQVGQVPVLVVYGVPGRDCIHGHSGGGLEPEAYLGWVREIAQYAGRRAVVILEPDALSSVPSCGLDHDRTALLAKAVGILADGPTTYVDAGHADWLDAATTARILQEVGVHRVRGFALNVAGFGAEDDERRHGEQIASLVGGAHFVVDTGRAGNGSDGSWCNPDGRALGALPGVVEGGGAMDARLWVKPPGESDGACGGGPPAGTFWAERAVEMAVAAGW